jgi:hypothetical protein
MVTSTRRGWWPTLEPALLAFAVVVCGSASALAQSRTTAIDRNDPAGTTGSSYWTATVSGDDSLDDSDDDDDAGDALAASPILLTSDDAVGRFLVETASDVGLTLREGRLATRGPPVRTWTLDTQLPSTRLTAIVHDSADDGDDDGDDDDDDGVDDGADAIAPAGVSIADDDSSHFVIQTNFDVALTLRSESLASRGPPERHLPEQTAEDSARHPQDSSDVDVDDDDDDDDDSDESDRLSTTGPCGPNFHLILSQLDEPFSFISNDHSLRAPPQ